MSRFIQRVEDLGIISKGAVIIKEGRFESTVKEEHVVPDNAPAVGSIENFLISHGADQYVDSLQELTPEEKNWRMYKFYTGAYSEEAREEFEASHNTGQPPSAPSSQ